jgi:hypothetical protein
MSPIPAAKLAVTKWILRRDTWRKTGHGDSACERRHEESRDYYRRRNGDERREFQSDEVMRCGIVNVMPPLANCMERRLRTRTIFIGTRGTWIGIVYPAIPVPEVTQFGSR